MQILVGHESPHERDHIDDEGRDPEHEAVDLGGIGLDGLQVHTLGQGVHRFRAGFNPRLFTRKK
jgi:hypothetical protein